MLLSSNDAILGEFTELHVMVTEKGMPGCQKHRVKYVWEIRMVKTVTA